MTLPLRAVLAKVSRSFYVSLAALPEETREAVALGYLLARAADTVADTRIVARDQRLEWLEALDATYQGRGRPDLSGLRAIDASPDADPKEAELLRQLSGCLELLEAQPAFEQAAIRRVLATLLGGMRDDLATFPGESSGALVALERDDDLRRYCYAVAGCVGAFWSEVHAERLGLPVALEAWSEDGVRFGRLLQLTNVLRDVARDLRHGRCYLPLETLEPLGVRPEELLDPGVWPRVWPGYRRWVEEALGHAAAGLRHTLAIPSRQRRLRLAGLLPLQLALRTLVLAVQSNPLDPAVRVKVRRREVYELLVRGIWIARDPRAIRRAVGAEARRLARLLG